MKNTLKMIGLLGTFSLALTAFGQQAGGQGTQSQACRAYATPASGSMTGGMMTGGMGMTGGAGLQAGQVETAVQNAVSCLIELRTDIETGQNAEEAALALLNIRQDLSRVFQAARRVDESSEALVQLEMLQQQVSEQREDALTSLDQVTESLSALGGQ